jgi:putative chitinase
MGIKLNALQLTQIGINSDWQEHINEAIDKYNIVTPNQVSGFIGQCQHESLNFTVLVENLNYSSAGLLGTWPSRFSTVTAIQYQRQPEKIANLVYANRLGNGLEAQGDGWKYRGRGLVQLTGKNAYKATGEALGVDLVNQPELLEQKKYAALSAGLFWSNNKLNRFCDKADWVGLTKAINGGVIGLQDRLDKIKKVQQVLSL